MTNVAARVLGLECGWEGCGWVGCGWVYVAQKRSKKSSCVGRRQCEDGRGGSWLAGLQEAQGMRLCASQWCVSRVRRVDIISQ